jgi:hypothetical protein
MSCIWWGCFAAAAFSMAPPEKITAAAEGKGNQ